MAQPCRCGWPLHGYIGDRPPNPALIGVRQDEDGHLWTMVRVADADWKQGVGELTGPLSRGGIGVRDRAAY